MTEFAAESHPGNRYQHNEDALGWLEDAGVWLVADGMGGHACGDVASRKVKQSIIRSLTEASSHSDAAPDLSLSKLIIQAHDDVVAEGIRRSAENMGSTVVLVRLSGSIAEIGWCGDSRVYLWRDQQLVRITRDHSLLEQLLESGVVDPAEAFGHPQKHVLVQALGITNPPPVPAELKVDLASGDLLLLCSDGLHDEMRDEEINALLVANPEPSAAVGALVAQVLRGPARDNISVVCIKVGDVTSAEPPLSVAQLRQRFERLPGRHGNGGAASADASGETEPMGKPAPRVMAAPKIALPTNSSGSTSGKASKGSSSNSPGDDSAGEPSGIDWDVLVAIVAVAVAIALVVLLR